MSEKDLYNTYSGGSSLYSGPSHVHTTYTIKQLPVYAALRKCGLKRSLNLVIPDFEKDFAIPSHSKDDV